MFQGDECSRGMSVLGDGCLGGWEFLLPIQVYLNPTYQAFVTLQLLLLNIR